MKKLAVLPLLALMGCGGEMPEGDNYVWITPRSVTIQKGSTFEFSATLAGAADGNGVRWSSGRGFITDSGVYTAPNSAGDDWIRAESRANSSYADRIGVKVKD